MKIVNNLIEGVTYKPSPNIGRGVNSRRFCVIHYTATTSASSAIGWMTNKDSQVSAHLHIARDGVITQLVPFDKIAWHAGKSEWKGIVGLNSHSIGIEMSATADSGYTDIQIAKLIEVGRTLNAEYPGIEYVGHSDIAPGRKTDPGRLFPWIKFRSGMGLVTVKQTTGDLNLRSSPVNGSIISVLPKGTQVNVIDSLDGWSHVVVCSNKLIGFVSNKYLV